MMLKKSLVVVGTFFLLAAALLQGGCTKTYTVSPLTASGGGSTSTNPNGPIIQAIYVESITTGSTSPVASVIVEDGGTAITSAGVTLVTPSGPVPVPYTASGFSSPPANSGITNIYGGEYTTNPSSSYAAGQNCTFIVSFNGATYTANFTAFTASATINKGVAGVTCTWAGGNLNFLQVSGNDNFVDGPPISSPLVLPPSSFPNDPAGAGYDYIALWLSQEIFSAFSGGQASSVVISGTIQEAVY